MTKEKTSRFGEGQEREKQIKVFTNDVYKYAQAADVNINGGDYDEASTKLTREIRGRAEVILELATTALNDKIVEERDKVVASRQEVSDKRLQEIASFDERMAELQRQHEVHVNQLDNKESTLASEDELLVRMQLSPQEYRGRFEQRIADQELKLLGQYTKNVPAFSLPMVHEDVGTLWKDGDFIDWEDWLRDVIIEKYWDKYGKAWNDQPYLGMYDDLGIDLDLAYRYRIMIDTNANSFVRPLIPKGCGLSEEEAVKLQICIGYLLTFTDRSPFNDYDNPDNTLGYAASENWQQEDPDFSEAELFKNFYFEVVQHGSRNFTIDFKGTGDDPIDLDGLETQWERKDIENLIRLFNFFKQTHDEQQAQHRTVHDDESALVKD